MKFNFVKGSLLMIRSSPVYKKSINIFILSQTFFLRKSHMTKAILLRSAEFSLRKLCDKKRDKILTVKIKIVLRNSSHECLLKIADENDYLFLRKSS
jgi:hypothetical protein